ncbi:MAG TPA: hypothetical protein VGY54_02505, partial [Polyangiaceae bacterium]|nr:hypothetical protein [Polyangiaceae bacterium]
MQSELVRGQGMVAWGGALLARMASGCASGAAVGFGQRPCGGVARVGAAFGCAATRLRTASGLGDSDP